MVPVLRASFGGCSRAAVRLADVERAVDDSDAAHHKLAVLILPLELSLKEWGRGCRGCLGATTACARLGTAVLIRRLNSSAPGGRQVWPLRRRH